MHTTRSVSRGVRLNNSSPLRRGLTPQRRRPRHRASKGIAPSPRPAPPAAAPAVVCCAHIGDAGCTCGNPVRPGAADIESKNYSAPFLQNILGITASEVDIVSGYSYCLKEAIIEVCQRPGTIAQQKGFLWQIVVDNVTVPWISNVATIMIKTCSLRFSDLTILDSDQFPLGESDDETDWTDVDEDIVDFRKGVFSLTTTAGRAFICYSFMPALMRLLQFGGQADLVLKLWSTAINADRERCTNFYLYHLVKRGFGKFSVAKRSLWREYVNDQKMYTMGLKQDQQALEIEAIKESAAGRSEGSGEGAPAPAVLQVVEKLTRQLEENTKRTKEIAKKLEAQEIINTNLTIQGHRSGSYDQELAKYRGENDLRMKNYGRRFKDHEQRFATHEANDVIFRGEHDQLMEGYGQRFETHDQELASHGERIEGHETRFASHGERIESHGERIEGHETRFENHEANEVIFRSENDQLMEGYGQRFETYDQELASHGERIEGHETRFETHEANEVIYRRENEKRLESQKASELNYRSENDKRLESHEAEMNSLNQEQHRQANLLQNITEMRGEIQQIFQEIRGKNSTAVPKGIPRAYIFFRIRECAPNVEDTIPDHEIYHQIFCSNESNRIVSRGVVNTAFTKPFLIALMGYSGAGKTFTAFGADGVFETLLQRLPKVSVTVIQILEEPEVLGTFENAQENIHEIIVAITAARSTGVTPANQLSSRTHLAIIFRDQDNNVPYGMMIDVAGCEKTENMSQLSKDMARDSRDIGQHNMYLRKLLEELATKGRKGFVSREVASIYKTITKLNREIAKFLLHLRETPAVRVVLCAHHDQEVILKTAWREIEMWVEKEEAE